MERRRRYNLQTGGNGASTFSIPYSAELDACDLKERAGRLRAEMDTQITPQNIYAIVAFNCKRMTERVLAAPYPIEVVATTATERGRKVDAGRFTYGISYPGKVTFGEEIDPYVASVTASAGSYSYPLWIMACETNGIVRTIFCQNFEDDALVKSVYRMLSDALPGVTFQDQGYHEFDEFHLDEIRHV